MKGIYENIDKTDSLSVTFNLLAKDENVWDLYGTRTRVQMQKACPFELSTFEGYCLLTSSFFSAYMTKRNIGYYKRKETRLKIIL